MAKRAAAAFLLLGFTSIAPALAADDLIAAALKIFEPIPLTPPELPGNPASSEKIELGKMLFFEPRLSASHAISCNSCHNLGRGGVDGSPTSVGHRWQRGGRNSPTVLNAGFNLAQFWDGRAKDLEEQAGGPIVNPIEMASNKTDVVALLQTIPGYGAAFAQAFPGEPNPVKLENAQKAIALFEATLVTPNAPFDRFLRGQTDALSERQKAGLKLFIDKGCADCHNGLNIGGGMYARFGLAGAPGPELLPPDDRGRETITKDESDAYSYKVPTLRNIALTAPYFHTGKVWSLQEAVAIMGTVQKGETLSKDETEKITLFLESLTGEQPNVTYPVLPPDGPTSPRPEF
jgi:cytochrome c peroxidase